MSRFESGQFPANAATKEAYLKAAAAVGRMDQVDMQVENIVNLEQCFFLFLAPGYFAPCVHFVRYTVSC